MATTIVVQMTLSLEYSTLYDVIGVPPSNDGGDHVAIIFVLSILVKLVGLVTTVASVSPFALKLSGLLGIRNVFPDAIAGKVDVALVVTE
jgi:hypothetical protein